jgi:2,4'-dihydroxyacetophenone dioxygenase
MVLPSPINHQDRLLTININDRPPVSDAIPGLHVHPLFLDSENGVWVLYAKFDPGTRLPMHFHTGVVHFFTISGAWNYVEYPDDVQTAGSYLFEPGGSIHTFEVQADASEQATGFMVVSGCNVNFMPDGTFINIMDAGWIESVMHAACAAQGRQVPRYIKPGKAVFSDAV